MREISSELQKLYNSTAWKKLRKQIRDARIMCERCTREGRTEPGQPVHHCFNFMRPDGTVDRVLFFNGPPGAGGPLAPGVFELLCPRCHRIVDGQESEFVRGCDANGEPLDKRSPWWTPIDFSKPTSQAKPYPKQQYRARKARNSN